MRYTTLLFDLDHTLFDFDASEHAAFATTLGNAGVDTSLDGYREIFRSINNALWARVATGELSPDDVRVVRFEELIARTGIHADPQAMADDFVAGLCEHGDLYPGARNLLDDLVGTAQLGLISNGLGVVARAKVDRLGLEHYFDAVVISGEVGVSKPDPGIFDVVFDRLGHPAKAATLMIGDNVASDIAGGAGYGVDTCWYAPTTQAEPSVEPTYRASSFDEIAAVARGG